MNQKNKPASWFEFKNQTESSVDLHLYDEIGYWGVNAKDFISALKKFQDKHIHLRINSPGGEVIEGTAIFNALRRHEPGITVHVDGIAASMASVIAMVGNPVFIADNAFFMIHDPSVLAWGTSDDLRKNADLLDQIKSNLVRAYTNKTGIEEEKIRSMMTEETWMDAREAVALGFADAIEEGVRAAASMNKERAHAVFDTFKKNIMGKNLETGKPEETPEERPTPEASDQASAIEGQTPEVPSPTETNQEQAQTRDPKEPAPTPENSIDVQAISARLEAMAKQRDEALARASKAEADLALLNQTLARLEKSKGLAPAETVPETSHQHDNTLTLEEFRALNPQEKSDFFKRGGKLVDNK